MSNNKRSSVEWYIIERHDIEIQSRLGKISPIQYDEQLTKAEQQAKAMHKEEMKNFTEDWYHNGPLLGVDVLVSTSIEKHYNETFGGNNEQQ